MILYRDYFFCDIDKLTRQELEHKHHKQIVVEYQKQFFDLRNRTNVHLDKLIIDNNIPSEGHRKDDKISAIYDFWDVLNQEVNLIEIPIASETPRLGQGPIPHCN